MTEGVEEGDNVLVVVGDSVIVGVNVRLADIERVGVIVALEVGDGVTVVEWLQDRVKEGVAV